MIVFGVIISLFFLLICLAECINAKEEDSLIGVNLDAISSIIQKIEEDYDFIIDEDAARYVLDENRIDSFQTLPFTYTVYKQWSHLSVLTKLPYLLDRFFLISIRSEFQRLLRQSSESPEESVSNLRSFDYSQLRKILIDFQEEKNIRTFFRFCDQNIDKQVEWLEYLLCRGSFDQTGHESTPSEFDMLENIVRSDFDSKLNDPTDPMVLDLIRRGII